MQAVDNIMTKRAKDRDDFYARFPDAAKIKIDNSGIQPPARTSSHSAEGTESFFARYPDAKRIRML
jgi:hypothetical protein